MSSALAAALTAGPGLGGADFVGTASTTLDLGGAPQVWQPLCLLATVTSVIAAISANLSRSRNAEARIVQAEACNAELEGLQTLVEFGQCSVEDAVTWYQQYVAKISFVEQGPRNRTRHASTQRHRGSERLT